MDNGRGRAHFQAEVGRLQVLVSICTKDANDPLAPDDAELIAVRQEIDRQMSQGQSEPVTPTNDQGEALLGNETDMNGAASEITVIPLSDGPDYSGNIRVWINEPHDKAAGLTLTLRQADELLGKLGHAIQTVEANADAS